MVTFMSEKKSEQFKGDKLDLIGSGLKCYDQFQADMTQSWQKTVDTRGLADDIKMGWKPKQQLTAAPIPLYYDFDQYAHIQNDF